MTEKMLTFIDEDVAHDAMRRRNQAAIRSRSHSHYVMVEGPVDGTWTVMPLRDAIDAGFFYSWSV